MLEILRMYMDHVVMAVYSFTTSFASVLVLNRVLGCLICVFILDNENLLKQDIFRMYGGRSREQYTTDSRKEG